MTKGFDVYTLIGPPYILDEGRTKENLIKEMARSQRILIGSEDIDDWGPYLHPDNFDPEWLLNEFIKIWENKTEEYSFHISNVFLQSKEYIILVVIKQEDERAYGIVRALYSLLLINPFIPIE